MNIPPEIPLITGIVAGILFVLVFVWSLVVASRARRRIRYSLSRRSQAQATPGAHDSEKHPSDRCDNH